MNGVIFDMDGTMFDSERIWREIWHYLPKAYGYHNDTTLGEEFCGTCGQTCINIAAAHFPELDDPAEFVRKGDTIYWERTYAQQPPEKPGLHETVEGLYKAGYRLAVASGAKQELIKLNIERAGLSPYFTALVSGHSVPHGKPAPDIFIEAARQLGCDPRDCYVVEDGTNGIRGAYAAGCVPMFVPDLEKADAEVLAMCHGSYTSLTDVMQAILD